MLKKFLIAVSSLYTYISKPLSKHSLAVEEGFSSPWRDIHGTLPESNYSIAMPNELRIVNEKDILIQKADHLVRFCLSFFFSTQTFLVTIESFFEIVLDSLDANKHKLLGFAMYLFCVCF